MSRSRKVLWSSGISRIGPTSIIAIVYWVSFITVWRISVSIEFNTPAIFFFFFFFANIESSLPPLRGGLMGLVQSDKQGGMRTYSSSNELIFSSIILVKKIMI